MTNRRTFLSGTLASAVVLSWPGWRLARAAKPAFSDDPFTLGVASGYPTPSSVVLWTRLAPSPLQPAGGMSSLSVPVQWEIATDERMTEVVQRGTEQATATWAHSVHAEPRGLEPGREYWYRFTAGDARSPIGRTRTAPAPGAPTAHLRIAVAACQMYENGYFNAYQHIVRDNTDLVVHTGDYIYELSWGDPKVRSHPIPEAVTLDDYRLHYALYKSDPDLAAAHAHCPWLVTWDDHEVFNDYAGDVVREKVAKEAFRARRLAAYRAYYEHMPLPKQAMPTPANMPIYAQRAFGDLASLYVLDQRQYRSPQACLSAGQRRLQDCAELADSSRTMLGAAQESWLFRQLASSRTRWNLLAQGTVMSHIDEDPGAGRIYWADGWNGYPKARERLMGHLVDAKVANPVVLSGDVHAFIVGGLHRDAANLESPIVASELVATSVTSLGTPQTLLNDWRRNNPNLLFANGEHRGYLRIDVTRDRLTADLVALASVKERNTSARTLHQFVIEADRPGPISV